MEERDARILAVGVRVPTMLGVEDGDLRGVIVLLPVGVVVEDTLEDGVIIADRVVVGDTEPDLLIN